MLSYAIEFTAEAEADIEEAFRWESNVSAERADRWLASLDESIRSLETLPERCNIAHEYSQLYRTVRQLLFGDYKLYFEVKQERVRLLHCRHVSRRPMNPRAV